MRFENMGLFETLNIICVLYRAVAADPNPVVSTHNGYVRGTLSEYAPVNVFKGIRFAASTGGAARWTHPPEPARFSGIYNATSFGNECPQVAMGEGMGGGGGGGGTSSVAGDEDCLFLNIWTPEDFTASSNYPVYFWIYGGRFTGGSGSAATYDGSGLAKKGIVVVTSNYRLGSLGFLAHPTLSAESGNHNASGNWGLQDQIAALHWTNENIQQFGGNPGQITIGGQSAGAGSVLALTYSPLGKGLFQGVIAESGARGTHDPLTGSLASSHRNLSTAEAQGVTYLQSLNVSSIDQARNTSLATIMSGSNQADTTFENTPFENNQAYMAPPLFRPVVDGYVLPLSYTNSLANNSHNDVAIMTGNNKDESGASPDPQVDLAVYRQNNSAIFAPLGLSDRFFELFPANTSEQASEMTNYLYRNQSLVSSWLWADAWTAGGARNNVYTYYWDHAPPGQSNGAFHGSEINYAFNNIPYGTTLQGQTLNWTSTDYNIAEIMSSYWVNFIGTGDPNGGNLTRWEPSSQSDKATMHLGNEYGSMSIASESVIALFKEYFSREIAW
ncbi:MAG: hypothetical protein MMC23_001590 [Stictis urceolatum]|nr:hypothetical protein [Stictis urceolata]